MKYLILAIGVTAVLLALGCRSGFQAAPTQCYEERAYRVFIPTPQEICPDPLKVFQQLRLRREEFNKKYHDLSPEVLERSFLTEFVGISECIEVWAEKWTTVKCNNQVSRCNTSDTSDQWICDNPAIPVGKLPDASSLPFYLLEDPKPLPCGGGNCLNTNQGQPDGKGIDIH